MDELSVFTNALIYTVCSQVVTVWLDASNAVSLFFLIIIFSIFVFIMIKMQGVAASPAFSRVLPPTPHRFLVFVISTVLNLTLQFQSNLVAKLSLDMLGPQTADAWYVASFACLVIMLLWLLAESFKVA